MRSLPSGFLVLVAALLLVPRTVQADDTQSKMRVAVSVSLGCSVEVADEADEADAGEELVVLDCGHSGVDPLVTTEDVDGGESAGFDDAVDSKRAGTPADDDRAEAEDAYTVVTIHF